MGRVVPSPHPVGVRDLAFDSDVERVPELLHVLDEDIQVDRVDSAVGALGDVWTGAGSPTLEQRRQRLPEFLASNRRPIDRAFVHSIFTRDHPGTAEDEVIEAFADAIVALDDSIPNGTYVDMCRNLPIVDPERIDCGVLITRGEYDGIAALDDLLEFFKRLPNPDKQLIVRPGSAHASFHEKNRATVLHGVGACWSQPPPVYRG
jgi:pimeloyl-ACP methyl ester carboxylesterase